MRESWFLFNFNSKKSVEVKMKIKKLFGLLFVLITMVACELFPAGVARPTLSAPTSAPAAPVPTSAPAAPVPTPTPAFAPAPAAPEAFARIPELQGGVKAKQPDDADFLDAVIGMILPDLSQVRTLDDGRARLDLSTGTIVRITPNSFFTLAVKDPNPANLWVRFQLSVGQLFIILKGGSVEVETPSGVATVRGSFMSVILDPQTNDALVQCLEGSCQLETRAGSFRLSTGRKARMRFSPPGAKPLAPVLEIMTENDIQAWLKINPEANAVQDEVRKIIQSLRPGERQPPAITTQAPGPAAP
jgi:hypothetical protein